MAEGKYSIYFSRDAAKAFRKIHPQDARRIKVAIEALAVDPRPPGSTELEGGQGERRIRVGNYRIVYDVLDGELVVLVLRVGHRREIYRK